MREACDVHLCLSASGILVILASSSMRAGACRTQEVHHTQNGTFFERSPTICLKRTLTVNCCTVDSLGLKNSCGTGCKCQPLR